MKDNYPFEEREYLYVHVNDVGPTRILEVIPHAKIDIAGDCGSVFGEYHPGDKGEDGPRCPYPHVILKDATRADLVRLVEAGIGFVADTDEEWGEGYRVSWKWREDDECFQREVFDKDYRTTYTGRK